MQTSEVTHLWELSSQKYRQLGRESFSPRPSFGWALILQHRRQPSLRWDCVHASALAQGFGLSLKKPTRPVSATGRRAEQGWAPPGRRLHPSDSLAAFYFTVCTRAQSLQSGPSLCDPALSGGFSRQELRSGLPGPPPGNRPEPGAEPVFLPLLRGQAAALSPAPPRKPHRCVRSLV